MANSEIDIMQQSQYIDCPYCGGIGCQACSGGKINQVTMTVGRSEVVSLQVVTFHCGMCGHDYGVELLEGDRHLVACPECKNANLQTVVGTA